MAISSEVRRAGPFKGDGTQTAFPFSFKVFSTDQVAVYVSSEDGRTDETVPSSDFTVTLNTDQENSPGGTVTLKTALVTGKTLAILSAVPFTQTVILTNRGGFYPSILNDALDKLTAQTQQNKERIDRALMVPSASEQTPEDLTAELLAAQDEASKQAAAAAASAAAAKESETATAAYAEAAKVIVPFKDAIQTVATDLSTSEEDGGSKISAVAAAVQEVISVGQNIADVKSTAGALPELREINTSVKSNATASQQAVLDAQAARDLAQAWATKPDVAVDATAGLFSSKYYAQQSGAYASTAEQQATNATAQAEAAKTSAQAAQASATSAATAKSAADASATAASTSAGAAAKSATDAAASATAADSSAQAAADSAAHADAGVEAIDAAKTAAVKAVTDQQAASTTAVTDQQTKSVAAVVAQQTASVKAVTDAGTAQTAAAKAQADAAAKSATAAAGSATAAKTSETNSAANKEAAATSASAASASQTAAAASATAAAGSAKDAATSKDSAAGSATAAATAQTAAEAARDKAKEYAGQASSGQVQADWNETDTTAKGYIQNKPVIPAAQVQTDWNADTGMGAVLNKPGNLDAATLQAGTSNVYGLVSPEGLKAAIGTLAPAPDLSGYVTTENFTWANLGGKPVIPAAQVQTDWNATTGMGVLKNKPAQMTDEDATAGTATAGCIISAATLKVAITTLAPAPDLSGYVTTQNFTWANLAGKPTIPAAQVNADWSATEGVAQILNKPIIPAAQVSSDWTATTGVQQILNKPTLGALAAKDKVTADDFEGGLPADETAVSILAAFQQFNTDRGIT